MLAFWVAILLLIIFYANRNLSSPDIFILNLWGYREIPLNLLGDSLGIFNSLVSSITLVLVYLAYESQKTELAATNKTLELQNESIHTQRSQDLFVILLQVARNHLENVSVQPWYYSARKHYEPEDYAAKKIWFSKRRDVIGLHQWWSEYEWHWIWFFEVSWNWYKWLKAVEFLSGMVQIEASQTEPLEWLVDNGATSSFKKYLNTIKHLEDIATELSGMDYMEILKSQINDSEIRLYHRLLDIKGLNEIPRELKSMPKPIQY